MAVLGLATVMASLHDEMLPCNRMHGEMLQEEANCLSHSDGVTHSSSASSDGEETELGVR
jgi:hypothetical protein